MASLLAMKAKPTLLLAILWFFATLSIAQSLELEELEIDGRKYKNASLILEGKSVKVVHDSGVSRIPLEKFPKGVQEALLPVPDPDKKEEPETAPAGKSLDATRVSEQEKFRIIERKAIPNGGEAYQILIAPELATAKGIEDVIQEIRKTTANHRNTSAFIYDHMRALQMSKRLNDLSDKEQQFYDLHFKGVLRKNGNTGFNQSTIWPEGVNGPEIVIKH